jgi:hypothetical protein
MTSEDLSAQGKEGRGAVLAALRELRNCGYVVVRRIQGTRGQWRTETVVFDTPQFTEVGFPDAGCPDSGPPDAGEPDSIQEYRENNQQAAASRASAEAATRNAAAAPVEISSTPPRAAGGKRRRMRASCIVTWTPDDEAEAVRIEADLPPEDVAAAVAALLAAGKQPVPGLVAEEIERRERLRAAEKRHTLQLAASASAIQVVVAPSPPRAARSRPPEGWADGIGEHPHIPR